MTIVDLRRGWCPSLLRPMESGDGWLVRVRPRAAVITAAVARAVAEGASRYGNGRIEITNRANLQVRGLRPETIDLFVAAMEAVGAADDGPAILVSPLAGADPGVAAETVAISGLVARALVARAYPSRRPAGVAGPPPRD
jgi:precorrin-3B synthase